MSEPTREQIEVVARATYDLFNDYVPSIQEVCRMRVTTAILAYLAQLEAEKPVIVADEPSYDQQTALCNLWCCTDEEAVEMYGNVLEIVQVIP